MNKYKKLNESSEHMLGNGSTPDSNEDLVFADNEDTSIQLFNQKFQNNIFYTRLANALLITCLVLISIFLIILIIRSAVTFSNIPLFSLLLAILICLTISIHISLKIRSYLDIYRKNGQLNFGNLLTFIVIDSCSVCFLLTLILEIVQSVYQSSITYNGIFAPMYVCLSIILIYTIYILPLFLMLKMIVEIMVIFAVVILLFVFCYMINQKLNSVNIIWIICFSPLSTIIILYIIIYLKRAIDKDTSINYLLVLSLLLVSISILIIGSIMDKMIDVSLAYPVCLLACSVEYIAANKLINLLL